MGITRRVFMVSGVAMGGGLLLGVGGVTAHLLTHNRLDVQRDAHTDQDSSLVNLWIRITPDNQVIVINPHTDMGQGSSTGLLQIIADELDAHWSQMHIETAPATPAYSNGKVIEGFVRENVGPPEWANVLMENGFYRVGDLMNLQVTGGSSAIRYTGWQAMRKAAAAARQMLIEAASLELDVPTNSLVTEDGYVVHSSSGKKLSYGELASRAATLDSPAGVSLKEPESYRLIGQSMPRVDVPKKVIANADYSIDAAVPDMQFAAVVSSNTIGAQVKSIENSAEIALSRGVSDVLVVPGGVAVVADNPWRAETAVRRLNFTTEPHANDSLSTQSILEMQQEALAEELSVASEAGKPADEKSTVSAEYVVPYLAHATLEPMNATVWQEDGKLHVHCGVQNPLLARATVAKHAGLDLDDVVLHPHQMGGGFGRRVGFSVSGDEPLNWLIQAVRISLDSGKPVKTTWSREADIRSDVYRPMVVAQFDGALDDKGKPYLWRSRSYGKEMNIKAVKPLYRVPNMSVSFADKPHPVPIGFWRSVEHSQHGFFVESFIDELADAAKVDPLEYRLSLLDEESPAAHTLRAVARMSGWRHGVDKQGRAMGVALVHSFGSTVAQVVEASMTPSGPRAHRVWCAVDCGTAVNPQAVEAQVQGAVNFALSAALYGKCDIKDGSVVQSNFHDYRIVGFAQAPRIEVELLELGSPMGGVGEIGVPPLAPALCNALFSIDGQRRRSLPLLS